MNLLAGIEAPTIPTPPPAVVPVQPFSPEARLAAQEALAASRETAQVPVPSVSHPCPIPVPDETQMELPVNERHLDLTEGGAYEKVTYDEGRFLEQIGEVQRALTYMRDHLYDASPEVREKFRLLVEDFYRNVTVFSMKKALDA